METCYGNKDYEVDSAYVDYLSQFAEHLFHNKQAEQQNSRKYIGVLITVHSVNYFVSALDTSGSGMFKFTSLHRSWCPAGVGTKERRSRCTPRQWKI